MRSQAPEPREFYRELTTSTAFRSPIAWTEIVPTTYDGLVLARTIDPTTGRSVIADRRTTCLLKYQERGAYLSHRLSSSLVHACSTA
jgi:hypothetical protein